MSSRQEKDDDGQINPRPLDLQPSEEFDVQDIHSRIRNIRAALEAGVSEPWLIRDRDVSARLRKELADSPSAALRGPVQIMDGKKSIVAVTKQQAQALQILFDLDEDALYDGQYNITVEKITNLRPMQAEVQLKVSSALYPRTPNHLVISRALARRMRAKDGQTELRVKDVRQKQQRLNLDKIKRSSPFD